MLTFCATELRASEELRGGMGHFDISEFAERVALRAFLKEQPREIAIAVAVQAVARIWPLMVFSKDWTECPTRLSFLAQRTVLTALVGSVRMTEAVKVAATQSADAVADAADAADIAIRDGKAGANTVFAADVADAAADAGYAVIDAAYGADAAAAVLKAAEVSAKVTGADTSRIDLSFLQETEGATPILRAPLWGGASLRPFAKHCADLLSDLQARNEGWEVWVSIYENIRGGCATNWDMLEQIALIPQEDWLEENPAHVNRIISGILAAHGAGVDVVPRCGEDADVVGRGRFR